MYGPINAPKEGINIVEIEYLDVPKPFWGRSHSILRSDTEVNSPVPDSYDVWLFTDPDARELYANQGCLQRLEQDIRFLDHALRALASGGIELQS